MKTMALSIFKELKNVKQSYKEFASSIISSNPLPENHKQYKVHKEISRQYSAFKQQEQRLKQQYKKYAHQKKMYNKVGIDFVDKEYEQAMKKLHEKLVSMQVRRFTHGYVVPAAAGGTLVALMSKANSPTKKDNQTKVNDSLFSSIIPKLKKEVKKGEKIKKKAKKGKWTDRKVKKHYSLVKKIKLFIKGTLTGGAATSYAYYRNDEEKTKQARIAAANMQAANNRF